MGRPAVLRLVFTSTGRPVRCSKAASSAASSGWRSGSTVCTRAVPSTCTTAGMRSCHRAATSWTNSMYGLGSGPREKISAARLARTTGATGRNLSRPLMSLSRSRLTRSPGWASSER